ncbi:uncharacterized protein LOC114727283 [Neltuma alba]|uniref:uncharacterized protein LOC114727283 n=1 Tax=Neltuma alba TaxID=207710 RepID=UPI0010A49A06|nr:uncharacterized protein LOC114727283 [Prosopis alba]
MEKMWAKHPIKVTPLNNGYFIVSFSIPEDRDFALQEGPWMIADHYLLVQRWCPNFNPWKADNQKRIATWIRFPDLPVELYNVESLRRLGNLVGKMLKIDRTTAFSEKGGFARICVELDLEQPLLPSFDHFGEERKIKYEGLHLVCFNCGTYGHRMDHCTWRRSENQNQETPSDNQKHTAEQPAGEAKPNGETPQIRKNKGRSKGGDYGP